MQHYRRALEDLPQVVELVDTHRYALVALSEKTEQTGKLIKSGYILESVSRYILMGKNDA